MADEVRRSGRANKGHHTKNADALDEPIVKPKSTKPKPEKKAKAAGHPAAARSQSAQSADAQEEEEEEEEEDALIRCVCGDQRDKDGVQMICCDRCEAWQHNKCLHLPQGDYWEGKEYFCEQCKPEDHQELLAAMARGEKPWIKWNKKGAKPPKSRPSDVKPGGKQEKAKTATPQPTQPAAPSPAATEPAAPTPTPTVASKEVSTSADGPNEQTEPKGKKEPIKSQPQSPLGEKRRLDSTSEKDGSSKKRRKSSAPKTESVAPPAGFPSDIDSLPPKQKPLAEKLRETLIPLITSASESRGYQIPDGQTPHSIATRLVLDIDRAASLRHGEPTGAESPFALQLRSIIFNTKKNPGLVDKLLSGGLKADDIVSMSSEEMASEEKQREYAAIREANEKQIVLTEEVGPRFRKTHKGDELVEDVDERRQEEFKPPPPPQERTVDEKPPVSQSPTQDHATVELPEDVGRREPMALETTGGADSTRRPSTNFDINSVFAQVRSPQNDQNPFVQRRQSSIHAPEKSTQGPGIDADVDRLLKDEDGDVEMSGFSDESIIWRGTIEMQHVESCASVARFVAGGDFGKAIPWTKLLSPSLPIAGRIEEAKGDEYITSLASTGSHDVAVLSLSPVSSEGRAVMDSLYKYFHDRHRWGVVPVDKLGNEAMRDLYVIPVPHGASNLPQFMELLEYCTIETPRRDDMLLLALVAKLPDIQPQSLQYPPAQETPTSQAPIAVQPPNGMHGPSPSPVTNPHGPSYSPVGPSFPANAQYSNNYPPQPNNGYTQNTQIPYPQAPTPPLDPAAILGPYMESSVVKDLLQHPYTRDTLLNLKDVLDSVPAARNDINVFWQYLSQKNGLVNANGNGK